MRTITLSRGYVAIVDDEDFEWLSQWKWCVNETPRIVYATRRERDVEKESDRPNRIIRMHRQILGLKAFNGFDVDHIDHNGLNNTRQNLRLSTRSENCGNQRKRPGQNKYKGVYWHKATQRWTAQIMQSGKRKHLGMFETELDAARAYDEAAVVTWGEYAHLNLR